MVVEPRQPNSVCEHLEGKDDIINRESPSSLGPYQKRHVLNGTSEKQHTS